MSHKDFFNSFFWFQSDIGLKSHLKTNSVSCPNALQKK